MSTAKEYKAKAILAFESAVFYGVLVTGGCTAVVHQCQNENDYNIAEVGGTFAVASLLPIGFGLYGRSCRLHARREEEAIKSAEQPEASAM